MGLNVLYIDHGGKMKTRNIILIFTVIVFIACSVGIFASGAADEKKAVPFSKVVPQIKPDVNILVSAKIGCFSPDFWSGQVLEVYGKNLGLMTSTKKFYIEGVVIPIKHWTDEFIRLEYPDSPTLGKKNKGYIKNGNIIISNQVECTLEAVVGGLKPDKVFVNYPAGTKIIVEAAFSGINKQGMSVRFRKKGGMVITKPFLSKVLSIVEGGETNDITALVPEGLSGGTYLVDLIQNGRVASDYKEFKVLSLIPIKKTLSIK